MLTSDLSFTYLLILCWLITLLSHLHTVIHSLEIIRFSQFLLHSSQESAKRKNRFSNLQNAAEHKLLRNGNVSNASLIQG